MRIDSTNARRPAGEVDRWCAAFEERCRERGIRLTHQRRAVYRTLAADPGHPTAESVHERLRPGIPSLSLATVYRVLQSLVGEGMVRKVSTAGGGVRFDANTAPHQHLVCRECGSMADLEDPALAGLPLPRGVPGGFRPEGVDVRILGLCGACAGARKGNGAGAARRPARERRRAPEAPASERRSRRWPN